MSNRILVRTDTILHSFFFLKVWTGITGLTITNSLSLVASDVDACNHNRKPSNPPSPLLSTYCH